MNPSSIFQSIFAKISAWWHDRDDERLSELAENSYATVTHAAEQSGVTAYQLVSRARNSRGDS